MSALELYGCRGCGSTVIEVLLEWAGIDFTYREVDPWEPGPPTAALPALNPLGQVPTLKLADATVMTESAAIIVALSELYPDAGLLPPIGSAGRASALRWIAFIAGNMYPAISVADFPQRWVKSDAARAELKDGSLERLKGYWEILERSLQPAPFLAGDKMSALDVYAAMLSRWRPGRQWVDANCPRIAASLGLTERNPIVARAWARNFKG